MPTIITKGAGAANGFGFCSQISSQYIYAYGNNYLGGGWQHLYVANASTNTFTQATSNLSWVLTGSGSTSSAIKTWGATNNPIAIPSSANFLEVYYYVSVKQSNGSTNNGDIDFGFGTTPFNSSQLLSNQSSTINAGGQPGFYTATIALPAGTAGNSFYFFGLANGGQNANVQFQVYTIRVY
jgi:hypothetical protein